jgi:hypothetical protein
MKQVSSLCTYNKRIERKEEDGREETDTSDESKGCAYLAQ